VENPNVLLMQRDNTYYVIAYKQLNSRGLQLRPIDARPNSVQLLNTGAYMQWARDIVPNDVTRPYLRLRELPVDALAGDVMVLKMEFDKPLAVQTQTAKIEKI
jgi:alpha-L-fucosidase